MWNRLNTSSLIVHSLKLNVGGSMLLIPFDNSFLQKRTLAQENPFPWSTSLQVAEMVKSHMVFLKKWSYVDYLVSKGTIWLSTLYNGPLRKHTKSFEMPCMIMVGSSGSIPSQTWKRPRTLPTKMSLKNLTRFGASKVLLWHVAIWWLFGRLDLGWALSLDFLSSRGGSPGVDVFLSSLQLIFHLCEKINNTKNNV